MKAVAGKPDPTPNGKMAIKNTIAPYCTYPEYAAFQQHRYSHQ